MNLGPFEMVVILVVALLLFGPKNLPKLGKSLGETVKNVRGVTASRKTNLFATNGRRNEL